MNAPKPMQMSVSKVTRDEEKTSKEKPGLNSFKTLSIIPSVLIDTRNVTPLAISKLKSVNSNIIESKKLSVPTPAPKLIKDVIREQEKKLQMLD